MGVWARTAIEAARQLRRASTLSGICEDALERELDRLAECAEPLAVTEAAPLAAYARVLRGHTAGGRLDDLGRSGSIVMSVPYELAGAWALSAAGEAVSLNTWSSAMIVRAPSRPLAWEAAAASSCSYLGEWVLAAALSSKA